MIGGRRYSWGFQEFYNYEAKQTEEAKLVLSSEVCVTKNRNGKVTGGPAKTGKQRLQAETIFMQSFYNEEHTKQHSHVMEAHLFGKLRLLCQLTNIARPTAISRALKSTNWC